MSFRSAGAALAAGSALAVLPAAALGATPAQNRAFAKQLTGFIKPVFARQAPQLKLGVVTCKLPSNGTVVGCKAHFSYPKVNADVVYTIRATLQETGKIKWTTTGHSCTDAKTGKKLAC